MMHYLRSGLSGLSFYDVDLMENYLIQTGIRGQKAWEKEFKRKGKKGREVDLVKINSLREQIMAKLSPLAGDDMITVAEHVKRLYDYLCTADAEKQLYEWAEKFEQEKDLERAGEYHQIYRKMMDLLDQVHDLLSEETIDRAEFYEILEAGIGEIEIGSIPQNVDRIVVGDMERTRLAKVKVLFFLGVNEGYIPKSTSKGGIISDLDREFLKESGLELSPTPRQQMFIQRLYLYLNLTKPSERLYLSFSGVGSEGKTMRPSYLIRTIEKIFPGIEIQQPQEVPVTEQLVTGKQGLDYLAHGLREYAEGREGFLSAEEIRGLYSAYEGTDYVDFIQQMEEAAFYRYKDKKLDAKIAGILYGWTIDSNISRMESYAACAYRHFLQYGLMLEQRDEFSFEYSDMGNTFHEILNYFAEKVERSEYNWFNFPKEWAEEVIDSAIENFAGEYGAAILESTYRYKYQKKRFSRILKRTVETLQSHINKGVFHPYAHEVGFQVVHDLKDIHPELSKEERIRLQGRIDRVDLAEDEDKVYVKIIDYKSGDKEFDLTALYYGLQLQLVVYMDMTLQTQRQRQEKLVKQGQQREAKEVVPAALLYYHVDDPIVDEEDGSGEAIREKVMKSLRMKGLVNDDIDILKMLEKDLDGKSDILPVEIKKDGSYSNSSKVMSSEEIALLSSYTSKQIQKFCGEILTGSISKNPYERKDESACKYCAYKEVCGFDFSLPGYRRRKLEELPEEDTMEKIRGMVYPEENADTDLQEAEESKKE